MAKTNRNINLYLLQKLGGVNISTDKKKPTEKKEIFVKTFETKIITKYGVKFSDKLFNAILHSSYEDIKDAFRDLEQSILSWKGTVTEVYPLFADFPNKVPDTNDAFVRTILNYLFKVEFSDSTTLPCGCQIKAKDIKRFGGCPVCGKMFENKDIKAIFKDKQLSSQKVKESDFFLGLQTIDLITDKDMKELFKDILAQSIPPSKQDMEFLCFMCEEEEGDELARYIPKNIVIKDTVIELLNLLMKTYSRNIANKLIASTKLTAKDTMKLIKTFTAKRAGDKIKLRNGERRIVLGVLNKLNPQIFAKEAYADREIWKKVAFLLHVHATETLIKYPNACEGLMELCYDKSIRSYESDLEKAFKEKKANKVIELLKTKPGVMIRNLARLSNLIANDETSKAKLFSLLPPLCDKVKTSLLLQTSALLRARANKAGAYFPTSEPEVKKGSLSNKDILKNITLLEPESVDRVFLPKGSISKMFVKTQPIDELIEEEQNAMTKIADIIDSILILRFMNNEAFKGLIGDKKKVFIDKNLKGALVPLSQKNAIEGFQALSRGSWMPLNEEIKILRLFCYWKAKTDIDLSAMFIKESGERAFFCYYGDRNHISEGVIHSGDVRSAPQGGHEFIDMNIETLLKKDVRYIISAVNSFSGEPFISQSCCVGILGINAMKEDILLDPKKVMFKQSLNGESQYNIPMLIDLKEKKVFIVDINNAANAYDNIVRKSKDTQRVLKGIEALSITSPNIYDLIQLFVKANELEAVSKEELEQMNEGEKKEIFSFGYGADFSPYQTNDVIKIFLN
jgi:hypothetical protein